MRNQAYIAIITAMLLIILGITAAVIVKPAEARDIEPDWTWKVAPSDITNNRAMRDLYMVKLRDKVAVIIEEQQAEEHAALEAEYYEPYYEPTYYAPTYYGVQGDPDGLNSFVGVVDGPNGTIETAYSSNVLYHYRTNEWTPDEFGFYRTSDGYYVVASNEYEEGTVIETSRGEAMVLDGGCDAGYIDFYTNW